MVAEMREDLKKQELIELDLARAMRREDWGGGGSARAGEGGVTTSTGAEGGGAVSSRGGASGPRGLAVAGGEPASRPATTGGMSPAEAGRQLPQIMSSVAVGMGIIPTKTSSGSPAASSPGELTESPGAKKNHTKALSPTIPATPSPDRRGPPSSSPRGARGRRHHSASISAKKTSFLLADEERAFDTQNWCHRILRQAFFNCIQRRRIRQYSKTIEVFERAFETIRSATGIENIEAIVRREYPGRLCSYFFLHIAFIWYALGHLHLDEGPVRGPRHLHLVPGIFTSMEDRSFSLLTYINSLGSEIEALEVENKNLLENIGAEAVDSAALARKRALLGNIEAKIKVEEAVVNEKEADIAKGLGRRRFL